MSELENILTSGFYTDGKAAAPKLPIVEELEADNAEEALPEFPRLVGPLHDIAEAITHDLAYEHKALGLLTYLGVALSGRVRIASDPWLQPRFYGCSVGPAGFGKTAVDKEIRAALGTKFFHWIGSVESGQALVEVLDRHPRVILAPDELADLFSKGRQTPNSNSSLLTEILKLYESNTTSRRVITRRKRKDDDDPKIDETIVSNGHLGIFGGVVTGNFEQVWQATGGGRTGLQSRFVLSYSEQTMPRLKTATDENVVQTAVDFLESAIERYLPSDEGKEDPAPVYFHLTNEAQDEITGWHIFEDEVLVKHPRALDMAKRFALLIAATTGATEISEATMRLGLTFADYQVALKDRLMPADSANNVEAFEKRIQKFYEGKPNPMSKELCINKMRPELSAGGFTAFNAAWRALEIAGKLVVAGKTRKGKLAYAWA